ncbi:MAG TPA: ABC transporter substrate-binding protein [Xanthobacteraceae bacterium]|nr:ABC transporter substrate-binding protein [Xanthobacteraceae bacterium]
MSFVLSAASMFRSNLPSSLIVFFAVAFGGGAHAQTPIKFLLDGKIDGTTTPFLLAIDKGYFRAEGIDVTILEPTPPDQGDGAQETIKRVAAGEAEMGFGDINAMIRFRDQNPQMPVKAVYIVYNKAAYSIVGRKSRDVVYPKDLEGKKLGAPPRDASFAVWKAFVSANALDETKITIENIGMPVREPMLAAGQVDAVTGLSFLSYINLKDRGVPPNDITVMLMADYGVDLYGNAIVVNAKFANENPELVKAFLRAFTKGLKDTLAKSSSAIDSVIKRNETLRKDLELERLKMAIRDNILTPEVKANGFGAVVPQRFAKAIDVLATTYPFKQKPDPADLFDASFLPSATLRKAN